MTKLNKKLSLSISIVVILVYIISIIINNIFIHKYYLYEQKKIINNIGNDIETMDTDTIISNIDFLEDKYNITIINVFLDNKNLDELNKEVINEFWKKDITLKKFWIEENTLKSLKNGSINKIYNQGKTKYSLLVKFMEKDNYLLTLSIPIEHSQETIQIINKFNITMGIFSVVVITILTFILSKKIIDPITKLKSLSHDISKLDFRKENIKTNDEIEELADTINLMSEELEKAHKKLNNTNENLKNFISDITHEMKTPVALIKAYTVGIQDGLDDGTYTDTIIDQTENISNLINTLLYWSRYENKQLNVSTFDLKENLYKVIKKYDLLIKDLSIKLNINISDDDFILNADEDSIYIVLNNLVSNAIKYNYDKIIDINLLKYDDIMVFSIKNKVEHTNKIDLENIWRPFYVLEKSRSKELSGTGLGLSIVKSILEAHNLKYGVNLKNQEIEFFIKFK